MPILQMKDESWEVRSLAQGHTATEGQGQDSAPPVCPHSDPSPQRPPTSRPGSAPINSLLLFILGVACTTPLLRSAGSVAAPREVFQGRTLLSVEPGNKPFTKKEIIGFVIGSVSSALYLFSRLPQIRTNFLRKSTQGISYSLFALVMLGNTLYGLSVLLKNPEEGQSEGSYVLHHLPWLVGSLGVLLLDTIISVQFFMYRHATPSSERQPLLPG